MEPMDIDSIVCVPDTPDRLPARDAKLKSSIDVPDSPDTQVVGDKVYIRSGIRKQFMRPPKSHHGSSSDAVLGKPISKIALVSKRHDHPSHNQSAKSETIQNGISYVSREGSVEGPTEHHCHGKRLLSDKGKQVVSTGGSQSVENGKNFQSAAQLHSQQSFADSRSVSRINNVTGNSNKVSAFDRGKGVESNAAMVSRINNGTGNINKVSAFDRGKGVESNAVMVSRINNGTGNSNKVSAFDRGKGAESNAVTPPKVGQLVSPSFSSPRNPGQKRLVRNGCISPCNVAKAQKDLGKDKNGTIDEGPSCVSSSRTQAGVHSRAPVADTQASSVLNKGKGIIPLSNEESGGQNAIDRDTVSINEILEEDDDGSTIGILSGGWRNTHNRSKKTHPSSSEVHQLRSVDRTCTVIHDTSPLPVRQRLRPNQLNEDWLQNTSDDSSSEEHHQLLSIDRTSTLIRDTSPLPLRERLRIKSRSNQHNEDQHQPIMDMNRKRQKQGSSSSSTQDARLQNTSDDSGIVFLGSSGDNNTTESRPTRTRRRINNLARVIELDEVSSGVRANNGGSNGASSSNSVDPAMAARQMEADEILARELQEQLYHEDLGLRFGEIDVHERLDLPHENVPHAPPRRTRQASTARTASTANPSRPPRAWPNTRPNTNVSRALLQNRMRLRNRFPGRPRTITSSSREVNTLFPSEMDVEMRMTILEALEEYNDIGVDNSLLEIHREFNENDYEMLLGLDENNHRHSGASNRRINDLPQTTLQNDLEEACAVCLETPTTGDTIRHLPCFHKFHKDCIDPWLTRKSSCPVCKHSIT